MFVKAETDTEFVAGFGVMLMSIVFICFMLLEERNEEISKLRQIIMRMKDIN
jgi:cbb3-type cytochrome oxidase subunit 3